jgi:hypothetical protein
MSDASLSHYFVKAVTKLLSKGLMWHGNGIDGREIIPRAHPKGIAYIAKSGEDIKAAVSKTAASVRSI